MNHNITTVQVPDMGACELSCYHEPNCVSINFEDRPSDDGTHSCVLNNATHRGHDDEFEDKPGFLYRGTEVSQDIIQNSFLPAYANP